VPTRPGSRTGEIVGLTFQHARQHIYEKDARAELDSGRLAFALTGDVLARPQDKKL